MNSTKKILYLTAGLLILGGGTFVYSQREILMGTFPRFSVSEISNTSELLHAIVSSASIEDAAAHAEASNLSAQSYAASAATDATDAETAWNNNDRSALDSAVLAAVRDGDAANEAAEDATDYARQAQEFYDETYSNWEESYNNTMDAEEAKNFTYALYAVAQYEKDNAEALWIYALAQAYEYDIYCSSRSCGSDYSGGNSGSSYEFIDAYNDYTDCAENDENNSSSSANETSDLSSSVCLESYKTALPLPTSISAEDLESMDLSTEFATMENVLNRFSDSFRNMGNDFNTQTEEANTLYSLYEDAVADYATLFNTTADLADAVTDAEVYLESANTAAENAAPYGAQGLSSKNLANSFQVANCTELTLNPNSYEMASTDTSANFDLTVDLTTDLDVSTYWFNLKNVMAFTLSEITATDSVDNITEYPVETYETQKKWFGTLVFRTSGAGTFEENTGSPANPLEITKTDSNTTIVSFKEGRVGDTIRVIIKDEQETCSSSFDLTQASTETSTEASTDTSVTSESVSTTITDDRQTVSITPAPSEESSTESNDDSSVAVEEKITKTLNTKALIEENYDCSHPFVDISSIATEPSICRMYEGGVVQGRTSDEFTPNGVITNAEFIKMVDGLLLDETAPSEDYESDFEDVNDCAGAWCGPFIAFAEGADVIRTRDFGNYFHPDTPITRGIAVVYVARALGLTSYDFDTPFSDVKATHLAAYAIAILSEKTVDVPYDDTDELIPVIGGYSDDTFRPDNNLSRSEAAALIYRAYLAYIAN